MGIFVLIICCFYTISGFGKLLTGIDEGEKAVGGFIMTVLGILAIIFQSILL